MNTSQNNLTIAYAAQQIQKSYKQRLNSKFVTVRMEVADNYLEKNVWKENYQASLWVGNAQLVLVCEKQSFINALSNLAKQLDVQL